MSHQSHLDCVFAPLFGLPHTALSTLNNPFCCSEGDIKLCVYPLCSPTQEPLPEAAALLLRHPGFRSVWGYGSLLSDGGVPHPVRHVKTLETHPHLLFFSPSLTPSSTSFPPVLFLFFSPSPPLLLLGGGVSRTGNSGRPVRPFQSTEEILKGNIFTSEVNKPPILHFYVPTLIFVFLKFYVKPHFGWNLSKINGWDN